MAQYAGRQKYNPKRPQYHRLEERLVGESLEANAAPAEMLRVHRTHSNPLHPPREGHMRHEPRIEDVLDLTQPPDWRIWVTGGPAGFSGTSRPSSGSGWW